MSVDAALALAARGRPVFPCREAGERAKAPYLPGESAPGRKDGGHWLASADLAQLRRWWQRWPGALIGLPTGRRSGLVVIDLDPKWRPALDMLRDLSAWCGGLDQIDPATGEIREPAVSRTQSGGLHLLYAWREGLGNRSDIFRRVKGGEGLEHIDVRGEGGYIVAPPSRMANGRRYEWVCGGADLPPAVFDPPALPRRLADLLTGSGEFRPVQGPQPVGPKLAATISDDRVRRYVEQSVRGILEACRCAGEGQRNATVHWAACRLGQFVAGGYLGRGEAEALLIGSLPAGVSPGERKILQTIRNGLERRENNPPWTPAMMPSLAHRAPSRRGAP